MNFDQVINVALNSDITLPHFFNMQKTFGKGIKTIKDFYSNPQKAFYNFDLTLNILRSKYPSYSTVIEQYYNTDTIYFKNMFIMKKEEFFKFCEITFDVLMENHKLIDYKHLPHNKIREIAHVAEILYGIYFYDKIKNSNLKISFLPISYISESPSCKILVSYHKKDFLIKSDIFEPIHSGRALATEASKDGEMSPEDYQWMLDNMIGDDTGDNISLDNRLYAEMTSIYWAWKNYDKLENPDYIGFTHYRRQFIFNPREQKDIRIFINNFDKDDLAYYMSDKDVYETIKKYDLCMVKPVLWKTSLYQQYKDYHNIKDLDFVLSVIKKHYPKYYPSAITYLNSNNSIFGNIFLMKKDIFFEYCSYIFDCLKQLQNVISLDNYSEYNQRVCGFMAERLTGIFINYHLKEKRLRMKQLTTSFIENKTKELCPAFNNNNIAVFCSTDDNYVPYCGVLIQSIIHNANPANNYDIIILKEKLSVNNENKLLDLQNGHDNISIRIYDVSSLINNKKFHLCAHFTIATYYRMYATTIFSNYDKIIYLDIDTIVQEDIANLYHHNVQNYLLAAVQDYGVIAKFKTGHCETEDYFREKIGVTDVTKEYFQAGILLFNIQKMKDEQIEESLIDTAINNKFNYVDQDVLNKVCHGKVLFLDSSWNVQTESGSKKGIMALLPIKLYHKWLEDRTNPKIIHYASYCKPWNTPDSDLADIWWKYARMTPFYEEILYKNLKVSPTQNITQNVTKQITQVTDMSIVKDIANYSKNRFNYYRCKLMANLTFGKMRKHYKEKKRALKAKIKAVRRFLKGK